MTAAERWAEMLRIVRSVRHDANNPLTAALGHVQLLLDDPSILDPSVRDSLGVIEAELYRVAGIIRRLDAVRTL